MPSRKDRRPQRIRHFHWARQRPQEELPWVRIEELKTLSLPRPLVLINGAFDLMHVGHKRIIATARDKGATVILTLDSDEKVAREKGVGRPILTFAERYASLSLEPIDYLIEADKEADMGRIINLLSPDLRVQGAEYKERPSRWPEIERCFVNDAGLHTTKVIERILERYAR